MFLAYWANETLTTITKRRAVITLYLLMFVSDFSRTARNPATTLTCIRSAVGQPGLISLCGELQNGRIRVRLYNQKKQTYAREFRARIQCRSLFNSVARESMRNVNFAAEIY